MRAPKRANSRASSRSVLASSPSALAKARTRYLRNRQLSLVASFHQQPLVAAGGLQDNQRWLKLLEACHELGHWLGGVLEALNRRVFKMTKSDVEVILRDVHTDKEFCLVHLYALLYERITVLAYAGSRPK
jgi:hypothetical protein